MYRVLVVDDEEWITDGLVNLLEDAPQFELDVYKAYSGTEAFRLLNEFRFDIVVSDICMPGMTGIDLAKKIREKWPLCQVIFLTGYDDFQYAQQAIRQKVAHYILKSEGDEALLEAVGECISAIEHDMNVQDALLRAKEETRLYKAMLRRNLVQSLLLGQDGPSPYGNRDLNKVEIGLERNAPILLLAGQSTQGLTEETALAIDMGMEEMIAYAVRSELVWTDSHVIVWALQPVEGENLQHARAVVKGMAEGLKQTVRQSLAISISFVFWDRLVEWNQALSPFEKLKQIAAGRLRPNSEIAIAGIEYFEEKCGNGPGKSEAELEKSFVSRLMAYISTHLDGDLSLCTLSDKLHLNPSYLSRRFKELTGRTLTETILKMRMERACQLLKTTSFKVSEIAEMVGYETSANFCRVFKKTVNTTPGEYRDEKGTLQ